MHSTTTQQRESAQSATQSKKRLYAQKLRSSYTTMAEAKLKLLQVSDKAVYQFGKLNTCKTERSFMPIRIEEINVGDFFRGKGKKGQRCSNGRSPFYGQYLDRKVTALRFNDVLDDIEVDFEVRSTRGRTQTKTTTLWRFIKWTKGKVEDAHLGFKPGDTLQPTSPGRAQRTARDLGLSDDRQRWQLPKASRDTKMEGKA